MQKNLLSLSVAALVGLGIQNIPSFSIVSSAHASCDETAAPGVNWQNCRKRNLILDGFDFSGSNFTRTDLSASDLRNTTLNNTIFNKTNLVRASLAGSVAQNANFKGVIASRTDFSMGNFDGADFSKAEISRSNFAKSSLKNTQMSKGDFSRGNFTNADLSNADLSFSNISRANFENVTFSEIFNLEGAYTYRTVFSGLDLSKSKQLEQWQLNLACGNDKTILPEGLTKPDSWPCKYETE